MADTIAKYGNFGKHLMQKEMHLITDTIKVFMLKSTYTPNMDTHEYQSHLDLASNEIASTGNYVNGTGMTLANKTLLSYDATNDRTPLDADDVDLGTITAADVMYAALVDTQPGNASTNTLISLVTIDAAKRAPSAQPFKITWNASGILAI
jgi:hypothetical protein